MDLLIAAGAPLKPQQVTAAPPPHAGKLSPCCRKPYTENRGFVHDEYVCTSCGHLYSRMQVEHFSVVQVTAKPAPPTPTPQNSAGAYTTAFISPFPSPISSAGAFSTGSPFTPPFAPATPNPKYPATRRPLTGNTYPVREQLKKLGGYWDPEARVWLIPERRYDEAVEIVRRGPDPVPVYYGEIKDTPLKKSVETRACWECNVTFTKAQLKKTKGSWDAYWCGCTEQTPKVLTPKPDDGERPGYYTPTNVLSYGAPVLTVCKWCNMDFYDHNEDGSCIFP